MRKAIWLRGALFVALALALASAVTMTASAKPSSKAAAPVSQLCKTGGVGFASVLSWSSRLART